MSKLHFACSNFSTRNEFTNKNVFSSCIIYCNSAVKFVPAYLKIKHRIRATPCELYDTLGPLYMFIMLHYNLGKAVKLIKADIVLGVSYRRRNLQRLNESLAADCRASCLSVRLALSMKMWSRVHSHDPSQPITRLPILFSRPATLDRVYRYTKRIHTGKRDASPEKVDG